MINAAFSQESLLDWDMVFDNLDTGKTAIISHGKAFQIIKVTDNREVTRSFNLGDLAEIFAWLQTP